MITRLCSAHSCESKPHSRQQNQKQSCKYQQSLIAKGSRDFLFSEVGLGGGDPNNQRSATSLTELANNIHNGIWAVYNVAQDPWRNQDYKDFRREWFK